ncbi:Fc.00g024820.m01.CDS01 [Cosmosporella sp. VM-42]
MYRTVPLSPGSRQIRILDLEHNSSPEGQSVSSTGSIRCSLRVVDLASNPHFIALSYVWGQTATPPHTVSCNSQSIAVTENCWNALYHLQRDPNSADPGRNADGSMSLWIDAICINQADGGEKISQIGLMGDIYSNAFSVCIWLGVGDWRTTKAMEYLKVAGFQDLLEEQGEHKYCVPRLATFRAIWRMTCSRYTDFFKSEPPIYKIRTSTRTTLNLPDQFLSDYTVIDLLSHPWISRVWTLQEAALNQRPWIRCGTQRLSWRCLVHSIDFISFCGYWNEHSARWSTLVKTWREIHQPSTAGSDAERSCGRLFHRAVVLPTRVSIFYMAIIHVAAIGLSPHEGVIRKVFFVMLALCVAYWAAHFFVLYTCHSGIRWRNYAGSTQGDYSVDPIRNVLQDIRRRKCKEPIDKSHGAHAVLGRLNVSLSSPDTSTPTHEVYKKLFLGLLHGSKSLNILLCVSGSGFPGQPSWIPDWEVNEAESWLDPKHLSFAPEDLPLYQRSSIITSLAEEADADEVWPVWGDCTPSSIAAVWDVVDDKELHVRGKVIGQINWCGREFLPTRPTFDPSEMSKHVNNVQGVQEIVSRFTTRTTLRCLWDMFVNANLKPVWYLFKNDRTNRMTHSLATGSISFLRWYNLMRNSQNDEAADLISKLQARQNLLEYHVKICNNLGSKKRTFVGAVGDGLRETYGNCPAGTRVGDAVVLVSGVSLPLILRRNQNDRAWGLQGFAEFESNSIMRGSVWRKVQRSGLDEIIIY